MKITRIEQQKHHSRLYSIFIDGKYSFHLHRDTLFKSNIKEGQTLKEKELQEIVNLEQLKEAEDYALLLLSHCDRSSKEIFDRLKRKKFEPAIIQKVIDKLSGAGYLDDYKFAVDWVNKRLKEKPRGEKLIRQELLFKGIKKEIIDKAINETFSYNENEELDLANLALKNKLPAYKKLDKVIALRRIKNFLLRRGFSFEVAEKLARGLFPKNRDDYSN